MKYLRVKWLHNHPDSPVWIYEEINNEGHERRKVEVFLDGSYGYAGETEETAGTRLAWIQIPSLEEISSDPQFEPVEISREEFENIWARANTPIER